MSDAQIEGVRELIRAGTNRKEIVAMLVSVCGVSKATAYRNIKEIKTK